ncbi:MAG: hypothetical protein ACR2NM_04075 [Bythopirellula sp.]
MNSCRREPPTPAALSHISTVLEQLTMIRSGSYARQSVETQQKSPSGDGSYEHAFSKFALVAVLTVVVLTGCDVGAGRIKGNGEVHLRSIVALYNSAGNQQGRAPTSEAELRDYVVANAQQVLEKLEIASFDELLISERDGLPFVVLYGKTPKGVRPDIIAYEQTGINGKRLVGFSLGNIEEVDETAFRKFVPEGAVAK